MQSGLGALFPAEAESLLVMAGRRRVELHLQCCCVCQHPGSHWGTGCCHGKSWGSGHSGGFYMQYCWGCQHPGSQIKQMMCTADASSLHVLKPVPAAPHLKLWALGYEVLLGQSISLARYIKAGVLSMPWEWRKQGAKPPVHSPAQVVPARSIIPCFLPFPDWYRGWGAWSSGAKLGDGQHLKPRDQPRELSAVQPQSCGEGLGFLRPEADRRKDLLCASPDQWSPAESQTVSLEGEWTEQCMLGCQSAAWRLLLER